MVKAPLRRAVLVAAAMLLPVLGLAAPAQADPTTGTITGRFTDSQGNGLQARAHANTGDGTEFSGPTEDGYFTLEVTPGTYKVGFDVSLPGGQFRQYVPGKLDFTLADDVVVTAGAIVTVNDTLLATGTISGRLTDRGGSGVQANVSISDDNGTYFYSNAWQDGYYSVPVIPGTYRVSFHLDGHVVPQHAYGVTDYAQATLFPVAADATVTVNDTVVDTGTIAGRFTDRAGNGLAGVGVEFYRGTEFFGSAGTEADGSYRSRLLPVGNYRVTFLGEGVNQSAYGKLRAEDADPIVVTVDQETIVNDSQLPTGTVRIRALDAVSKAPISRFNAGSGYSWTGDTTTGELILEMPVGASHPGDGRWQRNLRLPLPGRHPRDGAADRRSARIL